MHGTKNNYEVSRKQWLTSSGRVSMNPRDPVCFPLVNMTIIRSAQSFQEEGGGIVDRPIDGESAEDAGEKP